MSEHEKIGFIGAGNMATALIKGLLESGLYRGEHLLVSDKNEKAGRDVSGRFGVTCSLSNGQLVEGCSIVVLSVKPQNMREVLEEVKEQIRADQLLISIAAGIPLELIQRVIGKETPTIRAMPNTPALIQKGMTALAGNPLVRPEHMIVAKEIFDAVGEAVEVPESMMDAVTALSGSGPGYVFRMMECLVEAGVSVGLEKKVSHRLVIQTFLGAASLAKTSEEPLSKLREKVTSPGGTTAAGLEVFDQLGLEDIICKAVKAAHGRGVELGRKN